MDDLSAGCGDEAQAQLIQAARTDPLAFGRLYHCYLPSLYRYLRSRLPTDEDAADLTQQVFLQALEAMPTYQVRSVPFAAWLFRIARNAVIDARRRARPTVAWQALPESHQPAAATGHHDALADFAALIAPLTDAEQELLILRFVVGLHTKEIATIVGKRDGAIRMQLTRSLRSLKESIRDE